MPSRKITHGIADIKFTNEQSYMFCCCGWDGFSEQPESLNMEFQNHRFEMGEKRKFGYTELVGNSETNEFMRLQHAGDVYYTSGFSNKASTNQPVAGGYV